MAFIEHAVPLPAWLPALLEEVSQAYVPLGHVGALGCALWEPQAPANPDNNWTVAVYPLPVQVQGGKQDGCDVVAGFTLDVLRLSRCLDPVRRAAWTVCYASHGPAFGLVGRFAGHEVNLRVFSQPPEPEAASHAIDVVTGELRPRPAV